MNTVHKRACDSASFEIKSDYLYVKYKDDSIVNLDEAKTQAMIVIDLCKGKKMPFVIDLLGINTRIDDDARRFFADDGPHIQLRKAQAVLVNNIQSKLLTNFFIKYHKPKNPIKVFDNLKDALDWIKTLPS